jgi:hypothetical protein
MKNDILEFSKIIKESNNDGTIARFVLKGVAIDPRFTRLSFGHGDGMYSLIELDNEDVEYFKNKYLPMAANEMQEKIKEIKKSYEGTIR